MPATVEASVRFIVTVHSIRDAMTLNFGDLTARARDLTATSRSINLLMRPLPLVGFLLKEVSGTVRRFPM